MDNAKRVPSDELRQRALNGVRAQAEKRRRYWEGYSIATVKQVYRIMNGAKNRCSNPNSVAFHNYGGRGVQFVFTSPTEAAKWVLDNLGPRPSEEHSIDRIDNDRHYEPGNLRWATRQEQGRNKRAYARKAKGEAISRVMAVRNDITYECVKNWLAQGLSEEEILNRRKYARSSI